MIAPLAAPGPLLVMTIVYDSGEPGVTTPALGVLMTVKTNDVISALSFGALHA